MIQCTIDITFTPFCDTTILTYDIELSLAGKKISFNLFDDEYFTIPYGNDTIQNSPAVHQLTTQVNKNEWIVAINVEEPITDQISPDELDHHQTPCGKIQGQYQYMQK